MKIKLTTILLLAALTAQMQAFSVSKNAVVCIGKHAQMKISNMDLQNSGRIIADTASLLILQTTKERKITGGNLSLSSLKIAGDIACKVATITLSGDLTMQSGVMDIADNRLIVHGNLLGENEKTYVTASTGTIEKPLKHLVAGTQISVLGLDFSPLNDIASGSIVRSHQSAVRFGASGSLTSAERVYEFDPPIDLSSPNLQTLPHEKSHIDKERIYAENFSGWQKIMLPNEDLTGIVRISVFNRDALLFPKIITPNEATNEVFRIVGLEEYPDARLIVISKGGKILFDLYPYNNDFNGKNLPNGTYYYLFSETQDGAPVKKSFFEIIR